MEPVVFVSCGQFTAEEKRLGKQICEIVRGFEFEPFYAETQSNLRGLHENILDRLNECAGLVAVMHPRGVVRYGRDKGHTRGSVWVEQEIAIAAFLTHCLGKKIAVAAFIHEDVKREGIRDLLHLNPISFQIDSQVISRLPKILKEWNLQNSVAQLKVSAEAGEWVQDGREYWVNIGLTNPGRETIEHYRCEILIPKNIIQQSAPQPLEVLERQTWTHRFFRFTEKEAPPGSIYPGDSQRLFRMKFVLTRVLGRQENLLQDLTVKLFLGNEEMTKTRTMFDLISES